MSLETLLARPAFSVAQAERVALMLPALRELCLHHNAMCPPYARILERVWGARTRFDTIEDMPFLPVSLFKQADLRSSGENGLMLQSSGTTGQARSRIFVDPETSRRQSRALVATMKAVLGESRMPLLLIDTQSVIADPAQMTARGAGVLGMMKFGARPAFALESDLTPDLERIRAFVAVNAGRPIMLFGFTFLVWTKLYEAFRDGELDLSNAILIHSGGWKQLEDRKVPNAVFRASLKQRFGITRIHNFYGMVEQIGSIFLEASDGCLYAPNFTDVIIRDPVTWAPLGPGRKGLIEIVSLLPRSYPGHALLTEDLGQIVGIDTGVDGWLGKALLIHGRMPKAELRGCSDVVAAAA
jgi:hypothetical protein